MRSRVQVTRSLWRRRTAVYVESLTSRGEERDILKKVVAIFSKTPKADSGS